MISPTTEVTLPETGLPSMDEATVVVLQGCLVFLPISPAGSLKVPLVGGDQLGWSTPVAWAAQTVATSTSTPPASRAERRIYGFMRWNIGASVNERRRGH